MTMGDFMKLFNKRIANPLVVALLSFYLSDSLAACKLNKPTSDFATCSYKRFTTIVSCENKGTILSYFQIGADKGNQDTSARNYFLDPSPDMAACQQTSSSTYASVKPGFDVGHMTPIDIFDDDAESARQTNVMTNLLPQEQNFNRTGLWRKTEKIVDCMRDEPDLGTLVVMSGAIYGNNYNNDYFSESHGLPLTPDYFWKVVYSEKAQVYDAWIFVNKLDANSESLVDHSRTLESLILVLKNNNAQVYGPAIKELKNIQLRSKGLSKTQLSLESKCYRRRG
ncbi:DNA/RNA non-specific endonuclease [Agarivorans sp. DSG3-1]|uniref:DNA/RNA non-specific endonuclease n=1 Tax=Agarivorans sp. DSG3-1 TaxID=3342249 RepID=UPI00398EFE4B